MGLLRERMKEKAKQEAVKAKTSFDIEIVGIKAAEKIKIIKAVKDILGLSLKEAKEAIESLPKVVKK
jgi:large subunit ribosomal protein L7/L12